MPSITCLVVFPAHPQPQINTTFHLLCVNPRLTQLLRWEPLKSHGPQLLLGPGNLVSLICSPSLHSRFAKSSFPQPSYMFRSLLSSLHFLLHLKYKPPNSNVLNFLPQTTCKLISIPNWPILALSPITVEEVPFFMLTNPSIGALCPIPHSGKPWYISFPSPSCIFSISLSVDSGFKHVQVSCIIKKPLTYL